MCPVARRPVVALIATGDELVQPGDDPGPGQIIASNSYGLAAMFRAAGAEVRLLPIARDSEASLATAFRLAEGADLIVTIGGASVGDHDLVGQVAADLGMERAFWKVAMRPGKPLMAGRLGSAAMVGLPGNPVSAMVCGTIFILPMLDAMQGLPAGPRPAPPLRLAAPLGANGPREHYMRATVDGEGITAVEPPGFRAAERPGRGQRAAGAPAERPRPRCRRQRRGDRTLTAAIGTETGAPGNRARRRVYES